MRGAGRTASRRTTCSTCCCRTATAATTCSRRCARRGCSATFHYLPLHTSDAGQDVRGARRRECPVSEDISGRLLRLPFYNNLSERDLDRVGGARSSAPRRHPAGLGRGCRHRRQPGSSSLRQPDYWWHRARADLLAGGLRRPSSARPRRTLDVGSADAPSVGWMRGDHPHVTLDLFPRGSSPGEGVCGSATALPFARRGLRRGRRLRRRRALRGRRAAPSPSSPGSWRRVAGCCCRCRPTSGPGRTTTSGPGHHRRYTRPPARPAGRGRRAAGRCGPPTPSVRCSRSSWPSAHAAGCGARAGRRRRRLPAVSPRADRVLMGLSRLDAAAARAGATCRSARRSSWRRSSPAEVTTGARARSATTASADQGGDLGDQEGSRSSRRPGSAGQRDEAERARRRPPAPRPTPTAGGRSCGQRRPP